MQYKELKQALDSLTARYKATDGFLERAGYAHAIRAIAADLDTARTQSADAGEFLARHKLYDAASLDDLAAWQIALVAREELEALNRHREPVADAARVLFLDYGFSVEQLIWGDREAITGKAVYLARRRAQRVDVMVMTCNAWLEPMVTVAVKEAVACAATWLKTRERTADSARFLWLYGSPLTRALIASGGMAPDITAEHADRLQKLRSKAADAAQWLYMNSAAEPCFMQVFFLGAGRAEIIRARDSFV